MCLPRGTRSGALSFMPVRGSCVPCSGALSDSQGSPPHGSASSVVSAQSAAARAGSSRFHRGDPSDACGLLRPCRRSGTPQGIPAAEAVLRALTFPRLARLRGTGQRRRKRCRARPKRIQFVHVLVQACYPALAILTVKNAEKGNPDYLFAPAGMPAARLSLPLTIVYNVTVRVTSERYQE